MNANDEKIRAAIAEQAGDLFVANDEGAQNTQDSADLAAWLKSSPVHIEEFLGISAVARDLREARSHPDYTLEQILARARVDDETPAVPTGRRARLAAWGTASRHWLPAAAAGVLLTAGALLRWYVAPNQHPSTPIATSVHFETRHGELLTRRLADDSVLHLNTDSAITIRYDQHGRTAVLTSGEAVFEVSHDPSRVFRVLTGSVEVRDIGTTFDVRLERDSTRITVVEGEVSVGPSMPSRHDAEPPWSAVHVGADHQIVVANDAPPPKATAVDAKRATAWLHRQIAFDREPLDKVAAEFNRYAPKPIEIVTPELQKLEISGVFTTDDPAEFIAFLRSLAGVQVEETATRFRVSRDRR